MASLKPLIRFYDLSGPKPWSPFCWLTRYTLNYKQIPYTAVKISYPAIRPKCEELFGDLEKANLEATAPIIEILQTPYKACNDSIPIAKLLNERFTEKDGFKDLKDVDKVEEYTASLRALGGVARPIFFWAINDVYNNALDPNDGSREYFKSTREKNNGDLATVSERKGGEEKLLEDLRKSWTPLQERMKNEDGTGEPTCIDFYDASMLQWLRAASEEKYQKVLKLYGDNTFTKLTTKVEKYTE